jgi:hypothetical protein
MKKFKITLISDNEIKIKEVMGQIIRINPFIKTFIFKEKYRFDSWNISEVSTGFNICKNDTKKGVIEQAKKILKNISKEEIEKKINEKLMKIVIIKKMSYEKLEKRV